MRPRLLDLFCGAGGAAMGYHRAGFEVVGVDVNPQPHYPFEFHQGDAMTFPLDGFDAIHASPPCKGETSLAALHDVEYERLLVPALARLTPVGVPWVVENVDNADAPLGIYKVRLCGSSFGLGVRRHRWFWSNVMLLVPTCDHTSQPQVIGVYGHSDGPDRGTLLARGSRRGWSAPTTLAREAMGIDWMPRETLTQAIPPAYTEHVGAQLLTHLGALA